MRRMALISCWIFFSLALCGGVWAAAENHRRHCTVSPRNIASLQPAQEYPLAAGRILAVDGKASKVTVEHAPIPRFFLQRMTRIFAVEDPTMLAGLTAGDKIRFDLKRRDGHYLITHIENSN